MLLDIALLQSPLGVRVLIREPPPYVGIGSILKVQKESGHIRKCGRDPCTLQTPHVPHESTQANRINPFKLSGSTRPHCRTNPFKRVFYYVCLGRLVWYIADSPRPLLFAVAIFNSQAPQLLYNR